MKSFLPSLVTLVLACTVATQPAAGQTATPLVSAEPTAFRDVTAKLDPGGSLYLYLSTDQWLGQLSARIAEVRTAVLGMQNFQGEERAMVERVFRLIENLARHGGLESLAGVGFSGIAVEPGLHRTRTVLQRSANAGPDGYIWQWFGAKPHSLEWLDWLPADTAYTFCFDVDLEGIWNAALKEADGAGLEPMKQAMTGLSAQVREATGDSLEDHLRSTGGEIGVAFLLHPTRTFRLPLPDGGSTELPEPSLAIALKVKDDRLFGFLEKAISQNPESKRGEADGARWLTMPGPPEVPFPLRPTVARAGDRLWITTTDELLQQIVRTKAGQAPGLKGTPALQRLSRGLPTQGSSVAFVSSRFGEALTGLQKAFIQQAARQSGGGAPPIEQIQRLLGFAPGPATYAVGWQDADSAQSVSQGTQEPATVLVSAAVVAPTAVMAAMLLPALAKAKGKAQTVMCMNNMKQIGLALHMFADDNDARFANDFRALKSYLNSPRVLVCPLDAAGSNAANVAWEDFDFTKSSYEFLKPGIATNSASPATEVVARCKFHRNHALMLDGSVQQRAP